MARIPLPLEVRTLLEVLLDRPVEVAWSAPWLPADDEQATFAVYVDDTLLLRSLVVVDLPLSAYLGAAIGLLPVHWPRQAVAARSLCEELQENLDEVLDICAAVQNAEGLPHTTLYRVHHVRADLPDYVRPLAAVLGHRSDLTVRIAGYGSGRLSFVKVVELVAAAGFSGGSRPEPAAGPR
jgi:hypothetical protein